MRYRKQTQHIRKYRSGRWACINRGVKYKKYCKRKTYGMVLPTFEVYKKRDLWRIQHRFETPADAKEHVQTVGLEGVLTSEGSKFKEGKATETMDMTIAQLLHPRVLPAAREAVKEMKQRMKSFGSIPMLTEKGKEPISVKIKLPREIIKRTGPTTEQVYEWGAIKKINDDLGLGFSNWELNEMVSGADFGKLLIAIRNHPKVQEAAGKVDWKKLTLRK